MERYSPCPNLRVGKLLSASLLLFAVANFYVLIGNWLELQILADVIAGEAVHANRFDELQQRGSHEQLVFVLSWFACAILFLIFIARTLRTARESGAEGLYYTPRWVFWSFFIPFASMIVPYRAMQEAWRATDPEADSDSWESSRRSPLITLWWLQWVAASIFGYAIPKFADTLTTPLAEYQSLKVSMAYNLLCLSLTATAYFAVRTIMKRSAAKWEMFHGAPSIAKATVETE